jgi:hypothetical protein
MMAESRGQEAVSLRSFFDAENFSLCRPSTENRHYNIVPTETVEVWLSAATRPAA